MKMALLGYGKMGRIIESLALQRGHSIVSIIKREKISEDKLAEADVCSDFSHPDAVLNHIQIIANAKKNLVMGTTGWSDHLDQVTKIIDKSGIGFIYSPNFSIGVALFLRIVKAAAQMVDTFHAYDVGLLEAHHNKKVDSPSGTAKILANTLSSAMLSRSADKQPEIACIRCGAIPGTHTILFDSPADSITLTHQARNREGFAEGALYAAEWLKNKKGLFTLDDLLEDRKL
jgi:4-hydroxy-tetrahydrodipicolinate reductase